ncbi:hypothetical protein RhiirA1_475584 [Rhizophagus irregularis]|uniref:Uncharacterized protein n=1 Tax=Rhizophagus irregularis TaxID=588596 RepID=A0A2I1FDN7_9GLOM|nr:hypothetical protein RhiirA1_475584 [Rhizophagus irregularis]PKY32501.1 hypothetical protein RhiirB3_450722 [Rhizophagus irregularis]
MKIKRVRKANTPPAELQSLEQINISDLFYHTFNKELFLVKNIEIRIYVLMNEKFKELYQVLFQNLIKFAEENNISLRPSKILTNFEIVAINASNEEFSVQYGSDKHLSLILCYLSLAFVPSSKISIAFNTLKSSILSEDRS